MDLVSQVNKALRPVVRRLQAMITRGAVKRVYADRALQVIQCELLRDEVHELEHFESYGITSKPLPEAELLAVFVGGSRGHGVVIAAADQRHRITGLADGEVAVYNNTGATIILKASGAIEINAPGNVQITGNLTVQGQISDAVGSMQQMRTVFNTHTHPGDSGGTTGAPNTQMV